MERKSELSPRTKKAAELIALVIVSAIVFSIIMIIFLGIAARYKQLF